MKLAKMLKTVGWYDKDYIVEVLNFTETGYYLVCVPGIVDLNKHDLMNLTMEQTRWLWSVRPCDLEMIQ